MNNKSMRGPGRTKREMSETARDRKYPHQISLPEDACCGDNYYRVHLFADALSVSPRGHSYADDGRWHCVFCFDRKEAADTFRAKFGGDWFDPSRREQGKSGHLLLVRKKKID